MKDAVSRRVHYYTKKHHWYLNQAKGCEGAGDHLMAEIYRSEASSAASMVSKYQPQMTGRL